MDDTKRPNFHLAAFSNATTVNNSTYDPVPSPSGSPSANTFDPHAGATYFHYNSDGTITSKPMGKTAVTNNSNTAQQTRSSPTRDPATSTSSSYTDLAALKPAPHPPQPRPTASPNRFPDGGLDAWLVVLGTWCVFFTTWGPLLSLSLLHSHYQSTLLHTSSPSSLAFIASIQLFIIYASGLVFSKFFENYGPRWLLLIGSALQVYGWMTASFVNRYYQVFLAQGVCTALGASAVYYASAGCISTWFLAKRATAFGIAATGAGVGGVVFSVLFVRLVEKVGYPWTVRSMGFLTLGFLVVVNLTVKSRIAHVVKPVKWRAYSQPWRERRFWVMAVGMGFFGLGMFLPVVFLMVVVREKGVDGGLERYLVLVFCAAGIPGRILPILLAPKLGTFNLAILTTLLCSLVTLSLWLPTTTGAATTICFTIFYSFFSSAYIALAPMLVAQISPVRQIGVRSGVLFFVVGLAALIGAPVGGKLMEVDGGGWRYLSGFAGACMGVAAGVFGVARMVVLEEGVRRV